MPITGKQIDAFVTENNSRFKIGYYGCQIHVWGKDKATKIKGNYIARQYDNIINLVQKTKATVIIENEVMLINYKNGSAKVYVDKLVQTFLIPEMEKLGISISKL